MTPPVSALAPAPDVPAEEVALDQLRSHLAEVIGTLDLDHLDRLDGDRMLTVLSTTAALGRGIEAILAAAANDVAVRSDPVRGSAGLAARLNFARPSHLVEMVAGVSAATALRLIRVGSRTSPRATDAGLPLPPLFPVVGEALRAGLIGAETADVISKELTTAAARADVDGLTAAEATLVGQATGSGTDLGMPLPPDLIAVQARQWRDRLDQDGVEPRAEQAFQNREFWVSDTTTNGLFRFGGQVTVDVGAKLRSLFSAVLSPRTASRYLPGDPTDAESNATGTPAPDIDRGTGNDASTPRETRTPGQIRADVFAAMIDSLARSADVPTVTGASPTVVVTVTAEVLKNDKGTGEIVGEPEPVPFSTIRQILCDSSVLPAIIDTDGALVALGTEKRLFSRDQRLGMIARDGPTCGISGCTIPASACEAHHIVEHSEGGPTHTDNGALFCWFHHRMIDTGVFSVEMVDGRPVVSIPNWLQRKPYFH
ncbi:hypothetical protein IWX78_000379 [Mycetocola sp. CAN_C7]|uniref:HNH endonuclease signature motif containing protein n=1 Tax=Mycetocola sp. CAN_C7 TaxID=2787724 RepID=UPI0018CB710E